MGRAIVFISHSAAWKWRSCWPGDKATQTRDIKIALEMALYLEACLEEAGEDAAFIAKALGTIARAKGMSRLAKDTGLGRERLYKALSGKGNPGFATILKVISALGVQLHATSRHANI